MKTNRDKVLVAVMLVIALLYVGYTYAYTPLVDKQVELEDKLFSLQSSDVSKEPLINKRDQLQGTIDGLDDAINKVKEGREDKAINIQDFLLFLSTRTNELGVDIKQFNDLGVVEDNGVWRVKFDMQLHGYMKDVLRITKNIEDIGVSYDVKSVSIRQDGDLEYLQRYYNDDIMLEWFGKETEDQLKEEIETTQQELEEAAKKAEEEAAKEEEKLTVEENRELNARSIEEQLDILLGLVDPEEVDSAKEPKDTQITPETPSEITPEDTILESNFRETKMNFDFTIEFIMFADPKTNFNYIDLYTDIVNTKVREYTINVEGDKLELTELEEKISSDENFLNQEIDRVMSIVAEVPDEESSELREYLNYLLSRR